MGLFGRRSRASSNASAAQVPPTSAAAIAAFQAASNNSQQPGTRLAAGAAAAALRSQASTPVEPGNVTTKRMLRRSSISSNLSNTSYQHGDAQHARRGSVGSMTSRSFRSPSPHGRPIPADLNAPPVPDLPRAISPFPSLMTKRSFRRPASTEPTRVQSPTPRKGTRFASVDTSARRVARPQLEIRTSSEEKRISVNFSRPMSPDNRPMSPSAESPTSQTMRMKRNSVPASPLSGREASQLEYELQRTANEPVHRRRNLAGHEGSHFTTGTMGHRPTGTAVQAPAERPLSPTTRPNRMPLPRRISEEPDEVEEEFEEVYDPHTRRMIKKRNPRFKPKAKPIPQPARVASPVAAASPVRERMLAARIAASPARERAAVSTPTKPARQASLSPGGRTARFSLQPDTTPQLHEPSRSSSPRKSALKSSPSPRGPSPAGLPDSRLSWNRPGFNASEASDTSDTQSKRRSMRVSFDDQPIMIGTSATPAPGIESPTAMSPQEKKRSWFGLKKKASNSDESDEAYAPTPALPSFGSVRGKKDTPDVIQVGSSEEAGAAVQSTLGVALTTGEKTPSEAGSALEAGSENVREARDQDVGNVPSIAIDPGTPGVETHKGMEFSPEDVEASKQATESEAKNSTPALKQDASQKVTSKAGRDTAGDSDSDDSHYSDANEESVLDGDGFGSINAIVDSPVINAKEPAAAATKMADAIPPLTDQAPKQISAIAAAEPESGEAAETTMTTTQPVAQENVKTSAPAAGISGAEKVTESTEHMSDSMTLDQSARTVTAPVSEVESKSIKTGNAAEVSNTVPEEKEGVQSVSFNPRRAGEDTASPSKIENIKDWTKTQSYWADVNARRKPEGTEVSESKLTAQLSAQPVVGKSHRASAFVEDHDIDSVVKVTETPTPKRGSVSSAAGTPQKPLKSALKKTSVAPPVNDRERASLHSSAAATALTKTAMPEPRGALTKKNRPVSMVSPGNNNNHDAAVQLAQAIMKVQSKNAARAQSMEPTHRRSASLASTGGHASSKRNTFVPPMPKLKRRDSSDSDSSFKRAPSVTSEGGRVSMRRSMRAGGGSRPQSVALTASGRPMSMRTNSGGMQSVRAQRQPSPTRSLLGFKNKKAARANPVPAPRTRASRFASDSDDEGGPVSNFASRFDDSDDELGPLRPVRGIPKRAGPQAPSPDLDDSDSDLDVGANSTARRNLTVATSSTADDRLMELARQRLGIENRPAVPDAADTEAAHSPVGDDRRYNQSDLVSAFAEKKAAARQGGLTKRRSFFGGLGRKKRSETNPEDAAFSRNAAATSAINSATSTPQRPQALRMSTQERAAQLKKGTNPDSWPLPASPVVMQRPSTAQGSELGTNGNGLTNAKVQTRPGMAQRHFSADGVPLGRKGTKKKFMSLRRALGLHD